jgi:hypothetical protein
VSEMYVCVLHFAFWCYKLCFSVLQLGCALWGLVTCWMAAAGPPCIHVCKKAGLLRPMLILGIARNLMPCNIARIAHGAAG